jgi:signal transduction histidine kinase
MKIKDQSLKLIFFKYLISIGLALVLALLFSTAFVTIMINEGLIIPSNQTENLILEKKEEIAKNDSFDKNLIPKEAKFLFISKDQKVIASNMDPKEQERALNFHNREEVSSSKLSYMEISRKDGYVIISYLLKSSYKKAWMEKFFPKVNNFYLFIITLSSFVLCLLMTIFWSKKITKELEPMIKTSEEIRQRNLDFKMPHSNIKEFNKVLEGLDHMKKALSQSLQKERQEEENRKSQIAALAHDIKTPLTILRGNAELLQETKLDSEQKDYLNYILKNSKRIEDYSQTLILMNKTEAIEKNSFEKINSHDLAEKIIGLSQEICLLEKRKLKTKVNISRKSKIFLDMDLFERAFENILSNACLYSPKKSPIDLEIKEEKNYLEIKLRDFGQGFSKEDLLHAEEKFYRGDSSRHSDKNFGLGLYTARKIVDLHKGDMILENIKEGPGARVTIKLPLI